MLGRAWRLTVAPAGDVGEHFLISEFRPLNPK